MTGYIWLCEQCQGNGYINLVPMNLEWHFGINGKHWIEKQTYIERAKCPACNSRGWWEP